MDHQWQKEYHFDLAKRSNSVIALAKYISIETWDRIWLTNEVNPDILMRTGEVTLTQNLVYEFIRFNYDAQATLLQIQEAYDERAHGNDLEVCIEFNMGYLRFPVQAKLLSTNKSKIDGIYKHFVHRNQTGEQFKLLTRYADKLGSRLAFYLFYNSVLRSAATSEDFYYLYGCSMASAHQLQRTIRIDNNPWFSDVHPFCGKPFYRMFGEPEFAEGPFPDEPPPHGYPPPDPNPYRDVIRFFNLFGEQLGHEEAKTLSFIPADKLLHDSNWRSIEITDELSPSMSFRQQDLFNPKYRMVIHRPLTKPKQTEPLELTDVSRSNLHGVRSENQELSMR